MEPEELERILADARKDPKLMATADINNLLSSLDETRTQCVRNKTLDDINQEVMDALRTICILPEEMGQLYLQLCDYRYTDEIRKIENGKYIRWINSRDYSTPISREDADNRWKPVATNSKKLKSGGIVVDIKFKPSGAYVVCRSPITQKFFNIKFDENTIFQKLSADESLILLANKYISQSKL